jgi:hypothetical protein
MKRFILRWLGIERALAQYGAADSLLYTLMGEQQKSIDRMKQDIDENARHMQEGMMYLNGMADYLDVLPQGEYVLDPRFIQPEAKTMHVIKFVKSKPQVKTRKPPSRSEK